MNLKTVHFKDLTIDELFHLFKLRSDIFIIEQNCVYPDIDNTDLKSFHVIGTNDSNEIIATTRLYWKNEAEKIASIGRVCLDINFRNKNFGKMLMKYSMDQTMELFQPEKIFISAQYYLLKFYSELGFKQISDVYLEDGIEHIDMLFCIE